MSVTKRMLIASAIVVMAAVVAAQSDPSIGTWKLNLAKSTYTGGEPPKSSTIVIEKAGEGVKLTATTVIADGTTRRISYTANYDGKDAAVTGTPDYNAVAIKKTATGSEGMRKKDGKMVQTYTRTVSADGKTMTVKASGMNAAGKHFESTQVYDKQ